MFREENNLADVMGIMRDLAIDSLHDGMRFAADENGSSQIGVGERFERAEHPIPSGVPLIH